MDHLKILERAFNILKRYRALWVFGLLLALTTAGGGGGRGGGGSSRGWDFGRANVFPDISKPPNFSPGMIVPLVGGIILVGLVLWVVGVIVRYVSRTALIRMVNDQEATGQTYTIRQGFRLGWYTGTWRALLINLLIGVPLFLIFGSLLLITCLPLLLWVTENRAMGVLGTVITVGLFVVVILLLIATAVVVTLVKRFIWRACLLEDLDVRPAIRKGVAYVRQNLGDIALMWLLMVGVQIALGVALAIAAVLLMVIGGIIGGIPALVVGLLANLVLAEKVAFILGALIFAPIFLLLVVVPMVFLSGLREAFISTVWTLTYREVAVPLVAEAR